MRFVDMKRLGTCAAAVLVGGSLAFGALTLGACEVIDPFLKPSEPAEQRTTTPPAPAQPAQSGPDIGQLAQNPGFEQGGTGAANPAAQWTRDMNATGAKGDASIDAGGGANGGAAMRLSPNGSNDANQPLAVTQLVNATAIAGREIEFSAMMRTSAGAQALLGVLAIVDGSPRGLEITSLPAGSDWSRQTGSYTVPSGRDVQLALICMANGTSGSAWFDDVRLGSPADAAVAAAPEASGPLSARVRVDAGDVVRSIPREMFGTNIEWRWDGNFVYDAKRNRLDTEMVRMTREMGVSIIRYPGGVYSDFYHWRDGVGPMAQRPVVQHEPGIEDRSKPTFGTDEALEFADRVGGELMITVNAGTGTAQEAADWIRYVNRDRLRVRLWEVGNELYINNDSVFTSAVTIDPETYAARYLEFARAMRAADPRIKVGAIGGENQGRYRILSYPNWNETVLSRAGSEIDFLSVHNAYAPVLDSNPTDMRKVYRAMMGAPQNTARNLDTMAGQIRRLIPGRSDEVFLAVTEWGPFFRPGWDSAYIDHHKTLGSTVFAASMFKTLLESEETKLAAFWHLSDVSVLGWIGSTNNKFPAEPTWAKTAKAHMFELYRHHFGDRLVRSTSDGPTFDTEAVGYTDGVRGAPYLDVVASVSDDGSRMYLMLINRHFDASITAEIDVAGFVPTSRGTARTLTGPSLDANTGTKVIDVPGLGLVKQAEDPVKPRFYKGGPNEISVTTTGLTAGPRFSHTVPALSVTSIELVRTR